MNDHEIERICTDYGCEPHQAMDYAKLERNKREGKTLCDHCEGTGNELYSMYRKCSKCVGTGVLP